MNASQFVNMLIRMATNKAMNWGMKRAMRTTKPAKGAPTSPAQRQTEQAARATAKRARQAAKITRRMR